MISWCAYCQEFQGEVQPFDKYSMTHGICPNCSKHIQDFSEKEETKLKELQALYRKIFLIGQHGDSTLITAVIDQAKKEGISNTNILVGMIAPALWEIGELWAKNQITFHDEHRFTFQMRKIIHSIKDQTPMRTISPKTEVLLMNTVSNTHSLGIEILDFWLRDKGVQSQMLLWESFSKDDIANKVELTNPKVLGISVAMPEQIPATVELISFLKATLSNRLPKICVGGNAMKTGSTLNISEVTELREFQKILTLL